MLRTLLAKDLRRAWRNPVPWGISLMVPFVITALIGSIFGPKSGGGIGQVRMAFVDEDKTPLTEFLRDAFERAKTTDSESKQAFDFDAQFLEREEAVRRITENEFAAAVIIPKGFTDGFLSRDAPVTFELVKNPAQGIHPRIIEEMLGVVVTAMNAFKGLAGDQIGDVRAVVESDDDALVKMALVGGILVEARNRLEPVRDYLAPPLVTFGAETRADTAKKEPGSSVFAFILAGMAAMFLLYMGDNAMRDLYREARFHTLERFKTVHEGLLVFIWGKVLFSVVVVLIGAVILLGGGAAIFQFAWQRPLVLAVLVVSYGFCGAGIMGLLAAVAGRERRADVMNNVIVMGMALAGGCMFPPEMFPPFLREVVTPLMPTGWFASAVRAMQFEDASAAWLVAAGKLLALGLATLVVASVLFRSRLEKGVRA